MKVRWQSDQYARKKSKAGSRSAEDIKTPAGDGCPRARLGGYEENLGVEISAFNSPVGEKPRTQLWGEGGEMRSEAVIKSIVRTWSQNVRDRGTEGRTG